MAQYIGLAPAPADLPGPRVTIAPFPAMTTDNPSPNVTNRAPSAALSDPSSSARTPTKALIKNAATKMATLSHKYRWELAPAATIGALNTLGWWQHGSPIAGWETFGATGLAVGAGFAAAHGLKHQHPHLFGGAAGLAVALTDVAAATGFGFGAASFTVSAISTALTYVAYVPWLIRHRKEHEKEQEAKKATGQQAGPAKGTADRQAEPAPSEEHGDGVYLPATAPVAPFHNPFLADVIPYTDDASDDVRAPIRIGYDEHGNPVDLPMLYRHTLITGATDWGKSGVENLLIKKLLKRKHVEVYGIDLKPGAPELGPWAPKLKKLARTPEEARDLLEQFLAEGAARGEQLRQLSLASLAAGGPAVKKWIPGDPTKPVGSPGWGHGPTKFMFIDELGELIRQDILLRKMEQEERKADPEFGPLAKPPVATMLESGLATLRFLAMQYVAATQQASSRVFGDNTDQRGNYVNRISTRVNDPEHAQFLFGKSWKSRGYNPSLLNRPGEIFLGSPEMPEENPPKVRVMFVNDHDVAADVGHLHAAAVQEPIGRFAPQPNLSLVKAPPKPVVPAAPELTFPDGSTVRRSDWLDLYRVFCRLCDEQGYATKDDLTREGPYDSRDTVRRALEAWQARGVQVRKAGRTEQFYLPALDEDPTDSAIESDSADWLDN